MASLTVAAGEQGVYEQALVASTVDTVTVSAARRVLIIGSGTEAIYVTVDGSAPTVGAKTAYHLPKGAVASLTLDATSSPDIVVKLISSSTPAYSVQRA